MITDNLSRVFAVDQQRKPGVGRSRIISSAAAIAAFLIVSILGDVTKASAEPTFKNVPFVIVCVREGTAGFGYLSQVNKDGSAIYISMDGRRAMKLTAEGKTEKVPGMAIGSECVGKKIEDLRAEGLAIDFPK